MSNPKIESAMQKTVIDRSFPEEATVPNGDLKPVPIDSIDHRPLSRGSGIQSSADSLRKI